MRPERIYFVSPTTDFLLIGGASILAYAFLTLWPLGAYAPSAWKFSAVLVWFLSWPHFSATIYRLYHSSENIRQYPLTAFLIPAFVTAAALGSWACPSLIAPAFIKIFLLWSPYHFSGQSVGISLIYARRGGSELGKWERFSLSGFVFGTFLLGNARAEVGQGSFSYYGIAVPSLGIPSWIPAIIEIWMWVCGAALLAFYIWNSLRRRNLLPPIILLPATTQLVWFILGPRIPAFYEFVPLFHGLQYLLIAWAIQLKEKLDEGSLSPSRRYVTLETTRWVAANLAGGAVLFWALPSLAVAITKQPANFIIPIVVAAVQIHHFFVDGVIWKLRNRRVSSKLMVSLEDLTQVELRA